MDYSIYILHSDRSLFKHIKATEGRGRETTEYSSVSTESEGHHGVEENANNKIKSQIKKAMEAERLQDYLERIVQRIDDLEKHFAWKAKGKLVSDDPANGDNDATGGDYRRDQARDR
jgi:hypothetical protein